TAAPAPSAQAKWEALLACRAIVEVERASARAVAGCRCSTTKIGAQGRDIKWEGASPPGEQLRQPRASPGSGLHRLRTPLPIGGERFAAPEVAAKPPRPDCGSALARPCSPSLPER